ncbi:DUF368 domain-containing protein [Nocardia zapadnayensis]|uniref:DUF368 domain-containing protein n=1 Tax=Brevibacterium sp. R8603A2 TaxID=2929779 RepID=UPI001FF97A4E|nr:MULTISPECIES: DUF368 domain-containing protein [Actinomycetes]MCK1802668.1 DUF368 domain-containing protein [Brevibacterium sp. R8603A2]MCX0276205.1 DUF368 domain-containing protein [Nocardia zapadnayensis]
MSAPARRPLWVLPLDLVRGFLIGMAELVPGVSGGTVALVTGVYDQLIDSASHMLSAIKRLVAGPDRWAGFRAELARTQWLLIIPVLIGMAAAVLTAAGVMARFVADHPEASRGLFFGLVAMSILVPVLMLPSRESPSAGARLLDAGLVIGAAIIAFVLIGFAGGGAQTDPSLLVVFLAASIAICALVVPGVSGSFFLLAVGLYSTTMSALDDRDLGYIAVFGLGALVGLASFVRLLKHLLTRHRRLTLLVMTGLMIGSLRALWPWQSSAGGDESAPGTLLAPYDPVLGPVLLALLGAAAVAALVVFERKFSPTVHEIEAEEDEREAARRTRTDAADG